MSDVPPVKPPEQQPYPEDPASRQPTKSGALATVALVLGICAIIPILGLLLGLLAVIFGIVSLAKGRPGTGRAVAGIALGVVVGIPATALGISIIMPSLAGARELAKQAACQANLNSMGKSIALYTTMSHDEFPRLWDSGDPNAKLDQTGASTPWDIQSRNGMNNVWLLVNEGMISASAFRCPSDERWRERATHAAAGWTDTREFSYGIHWPYAAAADGRTPNPAFPGYMNISGDLALMADRSPGGPVTSNRPPSNHTHDGEGVLCRDYSVYFYKSTSNSHAGANGDDIYVNDAGTPGGLPQSATDTSIAPAGP